jgi:hypothetical protein
MIMKVHHLLLAAAIAAPSEIPRVTAVEQQTMPAAVPLPVEGEFPSLGGATAWLR